MQEQISDFGASNPSALFERFHKRGAHELVAIKDYIEENTKNPRTWGINEAALLIGRSVSWLRKNDKDVPKNSSGQGRWTLGRINTIREQIKTRYKRPEGTSPFVMAVTNFKGGVAKTTSAIHLGQKAAIEGLRALVIDLDSQGSTTYNLGNLIPDIDLTEEDVINTVFLNDLKDIKKIIRDTHFEGVSIIPSNLTLQQLDLILPNSDLNQEKRLGSPATRLARAISHIKNDFDVIIFDCPPNMGILTVNALIAANSLLMPVPPASFDRASFVTFCSSLNEFYDQVKQIKKDLKYLRIVLTKHRGGKADAIHESKIRTLFSHVLTNNFYMSAEVDKAATQMMSIYDLEKPINDKATYNRAVEIVDGVFGEIVNDLKKLWGNADVWK